MTLNYILSQVPHTYNTVWTTANNAYSYANGAPNIANTYAVTVGAASNDWANVVGAGGNSYAQQIGAGGNAYTVVVGAASNGWANVVGTGSNNYTNAVGAGGNSYAVTVGAASNTWANTKLSNTGGISFAGALTIPGNLTVTSNLFVKEGSNGYSFVTVGSPTVSGFFASYNAADVRQLYMGYAQASVIYGVYGEVDKPVYYGSNNAIVMTHHPSGRIGIGSITTPTSNLHIGGTLNVTSTSVFTDNASFTKFVGVGAQGVVANNELYVKGIANVSSNMLVSGSIGVGTASPASNLHIVGTSNVSANATFGSYVGIGAQGVIANNELYVLGKANVSNLMLVYGSIGVGTASPTSNLHVVGTANVTSNTVIGGTLQVGNTTGATIIVDGSKDCGVSGWSPNGYGVFGSTNDADSIGVYGMTANGYGVQGETIIGVGGLFIGTQAGSIALVAANSTANLFMVHANGTSFFGGNVHPTANNTQSLGTANSRWMSIYTTNVVTGDINMSNEDSGGNKVDGTTGNWTIQEGENDLFLINNKTGRTYKFVLEEVI